MKKVYSEMIKPGDLSHELYLLQGCGYTIINVFQDHIKDVTDKEVTRYTIIYEREE